MAKSVKTLIKFIDCDFVYGTVILFVGNEYRKISREDYRILVSYQYDWQSGLTPVIKTTHKATVMKFDESKAFRMEGRAMASAIKRILGF